MEDGFQIVRHKKRKRPPKQNVLCRLSPGSTPTTLSTEDASVDVTSLKSRIRRCWNEVMESQFYVTISKTLDQAVLQATTNKNVKTIEDDGHRSCPNATPFLQGSDESATVASRQGAGPEEVGLVVYGLGNFASCLIARYQLGLVLALRQHLEVGKGSCETYDPRYTETEKQILRDLGLSVTDENEEGKRRVRGPTVLVMPHCGKPLFNNLLWANWSAEQLPNLVILGNSFSTMLESMPSRLWEQDIGYIARMVGHMREEPVENSFTHTDIFNDLSIHWFPPSLLCHLPSSMWSHTEEPCYDASNVEIILQQPHS